MEYNAVNAKIKAMSARLLTLPEYRILCQSQSIEHFMAQVKSRDSIEEELRRVRLFLTNIKDRRLLSLEEDFIFAWSYIKSLPSGQNRQALIQIKGTEIDLNNILRIYRLKLYYPDAEIYSKLIPIFYRLSKDEIKQMAESPGIGEFIVTVRHTRYGYIAFDHVEAKIDHAMMRVFSRMTKRYPQSVAGVIGYFFAKKIEIHNLTAVMEGVKYHIPPEEILNHLRL